MPQAQEIRPVDFIGANRGLDVNQIGAMLLMDNPRGLNRSVSPHLISPSESPDTTDTRLTDRTMGKLGPRLGRSRITTKANNYLGLGLLNIPAGRFTISATNDGTWLAEAVAWAGVTPGTPTAASVTGMDTTAGVRFLQYRNRTLEFNGRNRTREFDGNRHTLCGIKGGAYLPAAAPTIALGGGLVLYPTVGVIAANVATLTVGTHTIIVGQAISVLLSDTDFNGSFTVTAKTSTTISYTVTTVTKASNTVVGTVATGAASAIIVKYIQITGNVATITTTAATSLITGNSVYFSSPAGNSGNSFLAATFFPTAPVSITVLTSTTFTYPVTHADILQSGPFNGTTNAEGHIMTIVNVNIGTGAATGITGTYYYYYCFANSTKLDVFGRMTESLPSLISAVTSPVNQAVTITLPTTHEDPQVDTVNLYRTTNGGFDTGVSAVDNDLFLLASVALATGTYTDTIADSTGWYLDPDGFNANRMRWETNIAPACKYAAVFGDRVFMAGFDPITTGTLTMAASASVTPSAALPDGVLGCHLRVNGDDAVYTVAKISADGLTITLDKTYTGPAGAGKHYTIYRNAYELYFSEQFCMDAWGLDGEFTRNKLEVPGQDAITGMITFSDHLLVFTLNSIHVISGKGASRFEIRMLPEPYYGMGAVNGDCIARVDNEIHFLSLQGPAKLANAEPLAYGTKLNTDWLDSLTSAELALACVGTDTRDIWYSVPSASGQTMNSKTWRYEMATDSWWEETGVCPLRYVVQDGTDGLVQEVFYLQGLSVFTPASGTLDMVSAALSGSVSGAAASGMSDGAAAFPTTNGGLVECYVRIYSATGALKVTRRITSNTATSITWSTNAALPASGTWANAAGDTYEIGNVSWLWRTKDIEVPSKVLGIKNVHVTFDTKAGSAVKLYRNDIIDGVEQTLYPLNVTEGLKATKWSTPRECRDYACRVGSRTGAVLRHIEVEQMPLGVETP